MLLMTLSEFLEVYGNSTTSNIDLRKWAEGLKIPYFHCIMKDEIENLSDLGIPLNVIINLQTSNEKGSDWNALYVGDEIAFYFSSYALSPLKGVVSFLDHLVDVKNRFYNTTALQRFDESFCGQLSLYFLYRINRLRMPTEDDFLDLMLEMKREVSKIRRKDAKKKH